MRISSIRIHLAAILLAGAAVHARDASACAILPIEGGSPPRLSTERVALIYDEDKDLEVFVREVTFDGASSAFAFVVPIPTRPDIETVPSMFFEYLSRSFPLDPPRDPSRDSSKDKSAGTMASSVEVLDVKTVGSFTAFTLAANDAAALDQWLKENHITLPAGGKAWLDHYVGLKFFFAAFRYEGRAKPEARPDVGPTPSGPSDEPEQDPPDRPRRSTMTSETVRIVFNTPVPFYPYLEPAHEQRDGYDPQRIMEIWLISRHEREPRVRRMARDVPPRWAFPWQTYVAYEKGPMQVKPALGRLGGYLADGDGSKYYKYHVQTFRDWRTNRDGWGDILFPVTEVSADDPRWRADTSLLLGDLDRGLHTGALERGEEPDDASFRVLPGSHGCGCRLAGEPDESGAWLMIGGIALFVARASGARVAKRSEHRRPSK